MRLIVHTCRIEVQGVDHFKKIAATEKCFLILWHNRLAIIPFILSRYTPNTSYAALVSASRDGEILSAIVQSYKNGRLIKVAHQERYQALRETVRHIEERKHLVILTPDGPRGPLYQIKPCTAVAALETEAYIAVLDWEANRFWELKTWDRLRLPKPFAKITFAWSFASRIPLKLASKT